MTIEELAIQGRRSQYLSNAERTYNNIYKMRKKSLISTFLAADSKQKIAHSNNIIATIKGVNYIDDSSSITPNATWFTLYKSTKPLIWIFKNLNKDEIDFSEFITTIKEKVKCIIIIDTQDIKPQFPLIEKITVKDMQEAVNTAYKLSSNDYNVIFSPASGNEQQAEQEYEKFTSCVYDL
jgi:UDP-N-acetylmuramoylalanine--D-glutamate ligase